MRTSVPFLPIAVMVAALVPLAQRPATDTLPAAGGDVTVIPITHGTVQIVHGGHVILVDPSRRFDDPPFDLSPPPPPGRDGRGGPPPPPPTGPHRPAGPATLTLYEGLSKPTHILVTDIHDDHLAPEVIAVVRAPATQIVIPSVAKADVKDGVTIANGETKTIGGVIVEAVAMLQPETRSIVW